MTSAPLARPRLVALLTAGMMVSAMATVFAPAQVTEPAAAVPAPPVSEPATTTAAEDQRLQTSTDERPIAPGVTLTTFDSYGPDVLTGAEGAGWLQGSVITADLTSEVTLNRIFPGEVAAREELTVQADRAGAVAAVNASYFDISTTGAPWGVGAQSGEVVQSPHIEDPNGACLDCNVYVTEDGVAAIGEILFEGTINLPGGATAPLDELNKPRFQVTDGIMAFTPVWGEGTRSARMEPDEPTIEVIVTDGVVSEILPEPGSDRVAEGTFTLVGRGTGVDVLSELAVGDEVSISYDLRAADDQRVRAAASGRQILVAEGVPQSPRVNSSDPEPHPRTAVGFSEDGTQMYMLTVDGRQPEFSTGVSLDELAQMMVDLGAYSAVNFDGGGSTTMVARTPGQAEVDLVNRPSEFDDDEVRDSDFSQRPVPDGLGLFVPEGSGELHGFWLATAIEPEQAVGASYAPRLHTDRVFAGLTRAITATPYDETYGAAQAPDEELTWSSSDPAAGTVTDGVFTAASAGSAQVGVSAGEVTGALDLTVLGQLEELTASAAEVFLPESDDVAELVLSGRDGQGYSAPIEPADVTLDFNEDLLTVEAGADGRFRVSANPFSGTQAITFTVAGVSTTVQVATERDAALEEVVVDDFESLSNWDLWTMRATGEWSPTTEGAVGGAGMLTYDFSTSEATRGIGIWPADGYFPLQGEPVELRLRVNSDPVGMRARIEILDANGVMRTVEPGFVTEQEWQELVYEVPDDLTYPIQLRRIYFNEIYPDRSYEGTTLLDELTVVRPELPDAQDQARPAVDDSVRTDAGTPAQGWQLGAISQVGISAEEPDGAAVADARRQLREIRDSGAELVIVGSGFVAQGDPETLALARDILDTELAGVEYHYVPGAAERFDGSLAAFEDVFGPAQHTVDHRDTRVLAWDTTAGSYLHSDWSQLPDLRGALDAAAEDETVQRVIVVQSQPLQDRVPPAIDQLSDRKEAETVQTWLTELEASTGIETMVIGSEGGTFDARHTEGVLQVTTGAATTGLSSGAPFGGFAGWTLIDVAPDGFAVTFLPWADQVSLAGPARIAPGDTVPVTATVHQGEAEAALAYPMALDWSSSRQVYIGAPAEVQQTRRYAAAYDPSTGELTALRRGVITLRATADGESAELVVRIRP